MRHCYYYSMHIVDCNTHLGCHIHNVSTAVFPGLLRKSIVVLGNLPGIQNVTCYLSPVGRLFSFRHPCLWVSRISVFGFLMAIETGIRD